MEEDLMIANLGSSKRGSILSISAPGKSIAFHLNEAKILYRFLKYLFDIYGWNG